MTYYDLPSELRGNLLEGRHKFPLQWVAPAEHAADNVAYQLRRYIEQGGLEGVFSVTILDDAVTVSVDRSDR